MRGVFERVKAKNLAAELEDQRKLYQREINGLEETSAQSRAELAKAQYLLETTLARFAKEKNELSDEIANSKRIRKLKAKQMSQRYREIREELTEMWQGERRKARDEQKALLNMYTSKLSNLEEAQPRLERKVIEAQELTEDLRSRAAAVMKDRMELLEEARLSELRFMQTVQDRNTAISALEYERDDLQEDLAAREEKLKTYQSSMRVLFGLSMKLIRKRLGATRKRLLSPFRGRRKAKELVDRSTMNAGLENWGRMSIELDSGDVKKD
jgi:chromosome segregation ATPase